MALVKVKPTSPGRRAVVKVVTPDLYKGKPHAPLLEKQSKSSKKRLHRIEKEIRFILGPRLMFLRRSTSDMRASRR